MRCSQRGKGFGEMYSFTGRIRFSECDSERRLSIPSLINYFQDCSTQQSEDLGVGFAHMDEVGCIWVLASWQVEICRLPRVGEWVEAGTLPYEFKGFLGLRNFFLKGKDGEPLAIANSQWTLLSTENMKPMRPTEKMLACYPIEPRLEMEYAGRKIGVPQELEKMEPIQVVRTHLDSNNHVNNGQFISMACAYIPEGRVIRGFRAEYKMQAHLGDVIVPMVTAMEDKVIVSLQDTNERVYCNVELSYKQ